MDLLAGIEDVNAFVDTLFSFDVLVFRNIDPDLQIINCQNELDLANLIESLFQTGYSMAILKNHDVITAPRCPYLRIVHSPYDKSGPDNFKLSKFLLRAGVHGFGMRVHTAMVVGLHSMDQMNSPINMPSSFYHTTLEIEDFHMSNVVNEMDMNCDQPLGGFQRPITLCQIAGIVLPWFLPFDCQWLILSYLEEPTAALIKKAIDEILDRWERPVHAMFQQREPRIPPEIACYFNVSSVQSTIGNATRPFLVPPAARRGNANPVLASL